MRREIIRLARATRTRTNPKNDLFLMTNRDFAKIFEPISEILKLRQTDRFRVLACQKIAWEIDRLGEGVEDLYRRGGVKALAA